MQTTKRKRYTKDTTPSDDIVTLIHLVRQNPALYNYKLQPNQRRRIDVLSGWAQIAAQIGNKYTVEECRRKWKNLRDTYHQYRLRKPKLGDSGLSKWRYAKELEFLSTVYQPKLKSHRLPHHNQHHQLTTTTGVHQRHHEQQQNFDESDVGDLMQDVVVMPESMHVADDDDEDDDDDAREHEVEEMDGIDGGAGTDEDVVGVVDKNRIQVHHSRITMDAETFILTTYADEDEVVGSGVVDDQEEDHNQHNPHQHHHQHHQHHQHHMAHHHHTMELSRHHDDVTNDGVSELVKSENSLDDDGGGGDCAGAEVDYEEVCLYEEADAVVVGGGGGVCADETIIGTHSGGGGTSDHSKSFQYIDANDFCITAISGAQLQPSSSSGASNASGGSNSARLKLSSPSSVAAVVNVTAAASPAVVVSSSIMSAASTVGSDIVVVSSATPPAHIVQLNATSSTLPAAAASAAVSSSAAAQTQTREELDLFFDFLKKKMSRFTQEEITVIQVEFLNCVLRREAEQTLKHN